MRRRTPEVVVGVLVALLLLSYVVYSRNVVRDLKHEAARSSQMYARIFRAFGDTAQGAGAQTLLDLATSIREEGIPLFVTDREGNLTGQHANLPSDLDTTDAAQMKAYVHKLDQLNPPVTDSLVGQIHFGNPPIVKWLSIIPALQAASALVLLLAAVYIVRTRGNAERERVWAGMARESAHQLGTPLSSLSGWVEIIEERGSDESTRAIVDNMRADLLRLDRVAHRFERIGREPRRESLDVNKLVNTMAAYFRPRVPKLANAVTIAVDTPDEHLQTQGDAVLLEWALEVLIKNAVDALAGRGGVITLATALRPEGGTIIRVSDDGPGIPRENRAHVFEPGFSTKSSGWGIGLSLAKRIVEENHGGTLRLLTAERGAAFEIVLAD